MFFNVFYSHIDVFYNYDTIVSFGAKRPPTQDQARRLRLWVRLYRLPETTPTTHDICEHFSSPSVYIV